MKQEKVDRINALARKSRGAGLNAEEEAEQAILRAEYLSEIRSSFREMLDHTSVERPDGSREALKDRIKSKERADVLLQRAEKQARRDPQKQEEENKEEKEHAL